MLIGMRLTGVFVPLITPFDTSGVVALSTVEHLAHELLDDGVTGLVALGTTAEPSALTPAEQRDVVDTISRVCRERSAPLLVGANTAEALAALRDRPEVTAALCLVPPFVRPGEAGAVAHLADLAAASPVPIVVYHVPQRTAQPLSATALRHLSTVDGVIGLKHAPGGMDGDTVALLADLPPQFSVLCGEDVLLSPMLALGAQGGILASGHVSTLDHVELVRAWHAGEVLLARELGHRLASLSAALFAAPNPTVIKGVLHAQGRIPSPAVRLPLLAAGDALVREALCSQAITAR
jgi:4-hydroxy-tetrahydrodipicolinate synthase